MSTLETILTRAMNDEAFANALFADPERALAEYNLPVDMIAKFKNMSRTDFEVFSTEERRSMAGLPTGRRTHKPFTMG
ncbi:MAG TPA: Os1348 family NHLP clan protein [Anaerolineales bacterium]|nr:Os1348 family NHLP clan protein [Anaerolineales bacterium]